MTTTDFSNVEFRKGMKVVKKDGLTKEVIGVDFEHNEVEIKVGIDGIYSEFISCDDIDYFIVPVGSVSF